MALYLIRHAQSTYNQAALAVSLKSGSEFYSHVKLNPNLLDPPITPLGLQQTVHNRPVVQALHFDKVFVSPALRTLQTCRELFQGHPSKPKIIVNPYISEIVLDICDISMGNHILGFDDFDWSEMAKFKRHWQLDILEMPEVQRFSSPCYREGREHISACMKAAFPRELEDNNHAFKRIAKVKSWWETELKEQHVGFVGHSVYYRYFLQQWNLSKTLGNSEVYKLT
jgi:broad specificity phosphatase PhoE